MGGGKQQQQTRKKQQVQSSSICKTDKKVEQTNPFVVLPTITLNTQIFSRLSERSLCCLAAVDRFFNESSSSDEVWEKICRLKGWNQSAQTGLGCKKGFLDQRNKVCVECERRTDYIFAITKSRLCEKCEHQNPRYALATISEARDGYGLSYAELKDLPHIDRYETRLFLRSQVADCAIKLGKVLSTDARARNICVKTPLQKERSEAEEFLHADSEQQDDDDDDDSNDDQEGDDLTFYMDDLTEFYSSSSSSEMKSPNEKSILAQQKFRAKKDAEKAARKAHKKQVKQENREKRASKKEKENKSGSSPKLGQSPPGEFHSKKGARRHNSYKNSKQGWKGARRQAGHTKELPINMGDTIAASPSQSRTYWLFEREDILQKWGLYDLSALVLQTIQ
eukprot:TRINITY_DN4956_c1_g1_i2.p1 TRINITY_DN4956_c1_g1~~TRINITY_DN4956_c1_g1_i2.p1  ORF type:complete len:426 (-),score=74.13 TRINITY_DN4956_c1_g1_i2:174-1355(-)